METRPWSGRRAGVTIVLLVTAALTLSGCTFDTKLLMGKIESMVQAVSDAFARLGKTPGGDVSSSTPSIGPVPEQLAEATQPPISDFGAAASPDHTTSLVIRDPDAPPGAGGGRGKSPGLPVDVGIVSGSASSKSAARGNPSVGGGRTGSAAPDSLAQIAGTDAGMNTGAENNAGAGVVPETTGTTATDGTGSGEGDEGQRIAALRAEPEATYQIRLVDGEEMTAQPSGSSYKTVCRKTTFTLAHLEALKKVLSGLPRLWIESLAFVKIKAFASLERVPSSGGQLLGNYNRIMNEVWLSDQAFSYSGGYTNTLAHELTHVLAAKKPKIQKNWTQKFWGGVKQPPPGPRPPSPTEYGGSCTEEDLAESVMLFINDPSKLDPERLAFIQTEIYGE